jgi:hypothetical protein
VPLGSIVDVVLVEVCGGLGAFVPLGLIVVEAGSVVPDLIDIVGALISVGEGVVGSGFASGNCCDPLGTPGLLVAVCAPAADRLLEVGGASLPVGVVVGLAPRAPPMFSWGLRTGAEPPEFTELLGSCGVPNAVGLSKTSSSVKSGGFADEAAGSTES